MKIVHLSTSAHGGAGIAATRLNEAMRKCGIDSILLTRQDISDFYRKKHLFRLLLGKIRQIKADCRQNRLQARGAWDMGDSGLNPLLHPAVADADVIYLHWITGGFLSCRDIGDLLRSGKRIVWVMHDQWPFTGGCHYAFDCLQYETGCKNCPLCEAHGETAADVFHRKIRFWDDCSNLRMVSPSQWLAGCADRSRLFGTLKTSVIRNTLDFQQFCPRDKQKSRSRFGFPSDKRIIAFASASATCYKRTDQVITMAEKLQEEPFIFVSAGDTVWPKERSNMISVGKVCDSDTMVDFYNAADVVLITSQVDNYPNILLEAAACGIPAVGFHTGGVPELILDGETGCLAPLNDMDRLADRLKWLLKECDLQEFSSRAIKYIHAEADPEIVVSQHMQLWK